jgi:two-component system sensor histidine kinase PilS (NtrC family)
MEDLKILHRLILSSISVGIVTIDENKKILYINESGERLLKTSGEKAEKKSIYQIIPEVAEKIEKGADEFEYQIVRSHDPPVILGMSISPLLNHMKEKIGYLLIIQDISDLKRMEERMKHEERMSTVGKLASVVAHEIRNPLASISGSVQLIEAIENLSEEDRHLLKIVVREIDHLNHWISDLLEFSKVSPGGWNVFDLHALVSQIVEMMKLHEENAETEFVVNGEENFPVYGDQSQIKIAIMNIIRNANEAMTADNRTITIDFVKKEMKGKEFAVLDIVDKGEGIPADVLPRIFEPFFTTKEKGTGLGLATVRRIIEDHGGEIMVESTVQKGTKFTLVLPIHKG